MAANAARVEFSADTVKGATGDPPLGAGQSG
jgi:hypothetical protein